MKLIAALLFAALSLQAGIFGSDAHREQVEKMNMLQRFKENSDQTNAIIKRGDFSLIPVQERGIAEIRSEVAMLNLSGPERAALTDDLKTYEQTVRLIGGKLKQSAPELHQHHRQVIGGLSEFNRRMGSIGLGELLRSWRELSRIKGRFVKEPDAKLVKAFDEEWTNVTVTITELYLDDDMEKPLFDYLNAYKAYFNELSGAYRSAGYAEVGKLKPLTYKIKMQFQMLVPELANRN